MRKKKAEHVDEYAETQVLLDTEDRPAEHDADPLSLYAEYEGELARDSAPAPARKRR
jgi:hypothetical protein